MSEDRGYVGTSLLFFLAGAAIGATIAVLITPKSGPELRGDLKGFGNRMKDRLSPSRSSDQEKDLVGV